MKRTFIMSSILLLILYILPPLFGQPISSTVATELSEDSESTPDTDDESVLSVHAPSDVSDESGAEDKSAASDADTEITLLRNGEIETLDLETYLTGVVCAEMPASFPDEALKAQAVAARTYTMHKLRLYELDPSTADAHGGAIVCADSTHCKAYLPLDEAVNARWNAEDAKKYAEKIRDAVNSTDGEILLYEGEPIAAVFHAASAAKTENSSDVWGGEAPYLVSVDSPGSEDDPKYKADVTVSADKFREIFLKEFPEADLSKEPSEWFKASERSEAGGIIKVYVGGVEVSGSKVRSLFSLNSANFTLTFTDDSLTFHTVGRGHGVGMSQYGARSMAEDGATYIDILMHYYTGVTVSKNAFQE